MRSIWPLLGLGGIAVLDVIQAWRPWPVPVAGLLDEPAHLITAALLLAALPWRLAPRFVWWALLGSVAIDVDHVPLYVGYPQIAAEGGRPVTHSLVVVAALLVLAALARGPARTVVAGLATGVVLHFVRDIATGPGLPLLWPVTPVGVLVPYAAYFAVITLAAVIAVVRPWVDLPRRVGP